MNPSTVPPPAPGLDCDPAPWLVSKSLPTDAGIDGEILLLGPQAEHVNATSPRPRVVFVVTGDLTVTIGITNHVLTRDAMLAIPAGRPFTVRNHAAQAAKALLLALPEPRVQWRLINPSQTPA